MGETPSTRLTGPQKVVEVEHDQCSTPSVSPPGLGEKTLQTCSFLLLPRDRGRCRRGLKSVSRTFCDAVKIGEGSGGVDIEEQLFCWSEANPITCEQ